MDIRARTLAALALLALLPAACAREDPETGLPGIRLADLRRQVEFLASDELGGREVGGDGIARAEQFIARSFASSGLKPLPGHRSFFQEFTLYRKGFPQASTSLTAEAPGPPLTAAAGRDFRPFEFSGSGELSAPVVFAGYGITAPEYGWDDYRGLEVEGRFVLVLRHEPGNDDPRGPFAGTAYTAHAYFRAKAENALRRGAAGLLLVDDPLGSGREEDLSLPASFSAEPPTGADPLLSPGFLAAHLSRELAEKLIGNTGLDLLGLQKAVDAGRRPASLSLGEARVRLRVPLPETRRIRARNVVGFLQGRDPALRGQWLLVGAHHDHIGTAGASGSGGDSIYNGADDNASGVAGMLALARLFARHGSWRPPETPPHGDGNAGPGSRPALPGWLPIPPATPRRSLVFAAFSAEEQGLFGSRELARQLAEGSAGADSGRLVRMLNLDMIGRNPDQPVQLLADDPDTDIRRILEAAGASPPAARLSPGHGEMASDHASFYRQGVPYLFFFTGLHPDYHGLDDEADRLSYPRLAEVIALAWRAASLLADAPPE
jgi:hypothetical protein